MTPNRIEQLVAGDQVVGSCEQREQHGKGFRFERQFDCAAADSPVRWIDAQLTTPVDDVVQVSPLYSLRRQFLHGASHQANDRGTFISYKYVTARWFDDQPPRSPPRGGRRPHKT